MEKFKKNLEERLYAIFKPSSSTIAVWIILPLLFALCGAWSLYRTLEWEKKKSDWVQVPGTIVEKKTNRKGPPSYRYLCTFKKRPCQGSQVIFDQKHIPSMKVGEKCTVLIDPVNPSGENSALLVTFNKKWYFLHYLESTALFLFALFLFLLTFTARSDAQKRSALPPALKSYLDAFDVKLLEALTEKEFQFTDAPVLSLLKVKEKGQQLSLTTPPKAVTLIMLALTVTALLLKLYAAALFMGAFALLTLFLGYKAISCGVDFEKRKIFRYKGFSAQRNNLPDIPFDEIEYYALCHTERKGFRTFAVLKNGKGEQLFSGFSPKELEVLVSIAKKSGTQPIVFRFEKSKI